MATQPRYEGQPAQPMGQRPAAMPAAEVETLTGAQWGPILAGAFAGIAALMILLTLGGAVGATVGAATPDVTGIGIGAAIWGAIVVIVSYLFAGWILGQTARSDRTYSAAILGTVTWIVSGFLLMVPLVLGLGNVIGGLGGGIAGGLAGLFSQPGMMPGMPPGVQPPMVEGAQVAGVARNVLWAVLLSQGLGVGATILGAHLARPYMAGKRVERSAR